jgi:hypothetical protein
MTRTSAAFSIGARLAGVSDPRVLGYSLSNYPNPASSETTINFTLPVSGDATLIVSDAVGRELMNIESKNLSAGTHTVHFNAAGLASGAYTYRLLAGGVMLTGKMDIVR